MLLNGRHLAIELVDSCLQDADDDALYKHTQTTRQKLERWKVARDGNNQDICDEQIK